MLLLKDTQYNRADHLYHSECGRPLAITKQYPLYSQRTGEVLSWKFEYSCSGFWCGAFYATWYGSYSEKLVKQKK